MVTTDALITALADRYTIERLIGEGGMAKVYLARDIRHNRRVALKVLRADLGAVLGVDRFQAEIEVTANLQHPNVLPLFDSGAAGDMLFYVMPYVEGESLRHRIDREKQLPVDEAIRIATVIAGALDYAHRHKVVHRDLKPENILLQDGQPLLADFGIALAISNAGGARITQTGLSLGTPQYMSPEQATGDRAIDGRTDIYSLGAMTYEMLTGEPPHTGSTSQAIIARVLTERPRSIRVTRPNVPEHVEAVIDRALEKLPADRWATAHDFADALAGRGTIALPSSSRTTGARRATMRQRLRDPIVVGLTVVSVAAVAFAISQWRAAHPATAVETIRFPIDVPRYVSTGATLGSNVAITPDGRTVAYVGGTADGSSQQLFVRSIDDVKPRALPGSEATQGFFASPDGKWIGFWTKGRLMKVAMTGGAPIVLNPDVPYDGASWTRSGQIVMAARGRLVTISENGGDAVPIELTGDSSSNARAPIVLADGETVVYAGIHRSTPMMVAANLSSRRQASLGIPAALPLGVIDDHLIYATASGQIMAVAFDAQALRVSGAPLQVATTTVSTAGNSVPIAALSASGALVVQSGSGVAELVAVDRRGLARQIIPARHAYSSPRYSPDGRRIAVTIEVEGRRDIHLIEMSAQTLVALTDDAMSDRPEWTPDGTRVLFHTVRRGARVGSTIGTRPVDLSAPAAPVFSAGLNSELWEAVATPDGKSVVLQRDAARLRTGADVVLRRLDGDTTVTVISATPVEETQPRVSPDGRWVAFQANTPGSTSQVVVKRISGSGGQVVVSAGAGSEPVWARDGKHLYYRDGKQLVEVAYTATPDFAVTSRTPLFADVFSLAPAPHANYDVSPDGATFLMLRPTENRQYVYVHNWRAEFRRLLAAQRAR